MKTQTMNTRTIIILIALTLIALFLIFQDQPSTSGEAVTTTQRSITETDTIQVFVDTNHHVNVIRTSEQYISKEFYTPYGQLLHKEYYDNTIKYYEFDYTYNGNPMQGIQQPVKVTDNDRITKEYLEFSSIDPTLPTLTKITIPLTWQGLTADLYPEPPTELIYYTAYHYTLIPHLNKISVNGYHGNTKEEAIAAISTAKPDIHYLLGNPQDILIFPDFTKDLEFTYNMMAGKKHLMKSQSLTKNTLLEIMEYTYHTDGKINTVTSKVDLTNDGTFDGNTVTQYFYNQNNILTTTTDTYQDGTTTTYTLDWDKPIPDKYATLLEIIGPSGPLKHGHMYDEPGFLLIDDPTALFR